MTVSIKYATITPNALAMRLITELACSISCRCVNEDYFEISIRSDSDWVLSRAKSILAEYA